MFKIPSGIFDKYFEVVDSLYEENNIADETTLHFIKKTQCPNCIKGSTSVYKPGGPIPFTLGVCPYCGGSNYIEEETTSTIYLRIYVDRKKWIRIGNLEVPDGTVQIIGKKLDLTKVKQCRYMSFFSQSDLKYKLDSQPFPHGFGNKYFVAYCLKT